MKITKVAFLHTKHRQRQQQQQQQRQHRQLLHHSNMLLKTNKVLIAPIASGCGSLVVDVADSRRQRHGLSSNSCDGNSNSNNSNSTAATSNMQQSRLQSYILRMKQKSFSYCCRCRGSDASDISPDLSPARAKANAQAQIQIHLPRCLDDAVDSPIRLSNFKQIILLAAL